MEVHTKHLAQHVVQAAALLKTEAHRPFARAVVRCERVWEPIVQPARTPIAEAEGEDLERRDSMCEEAPPKFEVE